MNEPQNPTGHDALSKTPEATFTMYFDEAQTGTSDNPSHYSVTVESKPAEEGRCRSLPICPTCHGATVIRKRLLWSRKGKTKQKRCPRCLGAGHLTSPD